MDRRRRGAYGRAFHALRTRTERALRLKLADALFALLAASLAVPLFVARELPIQDLPQHLAAVRVLHDYRDPSFNFEHYFELTPFATQYLSVYYAAHVLAYVFGVLIALKLVIAAALVTLPFAVRALLSELGRPGEYALFTLPLAYNAHLVLGFLNFVAALPLLFYGLALAVRIAKRGAPRDRVVFGLIAVLCFLTHVVPFALLVIGALLLRSVRVAVWLLPALALAAIWSRVNPAGRLLSSSAKFWAAPTPTLSEAWDELPLWLTDVLQGNGGAWLLRALCALSLLIVVLGARALFRSSTTEQRRLAWLVPICVLGYFCLPDGYDFIWPINARFALLALLCALPLLPPLASARLRALVFGLCGVLGIWAVSSVAVAFHASARDEYAGLDDVLQPLPRGGRVVGLIFDRGSRYVKFSPFLHAAALVQFERGGVAMFSFADFPTSIYRFRERTRPPRVPPRWEWLPQRVDSLRSLAYYDYALTRGGPQRLPGFHRVSARAAWALWRRDR